MRKLLRSTYFLSCSSKQQTELLFHCLKVLTFEGEVGKGNISEALLPENKIMGLDLPNSYTNNNEVKKQDYTQLFKNVLPIVQGRKTAMWNEFWC